MATTKRKRRSKHRGNAAGMVEVRGRTSKGGGGATTKASSAKLTPQERRLARLETPPNWKSAFQKAGLAAVVFALAVIVLFRRPIVAAVALGLFTFALYVPLSYYTDLFIYRRHQRRKLKASGAA
jgi:hypothetical protein